MAGRDIIVVGASAGGVEALSRLVGDLPDDLPAAIFLVLHMAPHPGSTLLRILSRQTELPLAHPRDGEPVRPGRVYVAVPDRHLVLVPGAVRVTTGPKENGHRPAVDTLFRTAAGCYGSRVVGVVLSGTRDDGTAGLRAIHARGGLAMAGCGRSTTAASPGTAAGSATASRPTACSSGRAPASKRRCGQRPTGRWRNGRGCAGDWATGPGNVTPTSRPSTSGWRRPRWPARPRRSSSSVTRSQSRRR